MWIRNAASCFIVWTIVMFLLVKLLQWTYLYGDHWAWISCFLLFIPNYEVAIWWITRDWNAFLHPLESASFMGEYGQPPTVLMHLIEWYFFFFFCRWTGIAIWFGFLVCFLPCLTFLSRLLPSRVIWRLGLVSWYSADWSLGFYGIAFSCL